MVATKTEKLQALLKQNSRKSCCIGLYQYTWWTHWRVHTCVLLVCGWCLWFRLDALVLIKQNFSLAYSKTLDNSLQLTDNRSCAVQSVVLTLKMSDHGESKSWQMVVYIDYSHKASVATSKWAANMYSICMHTAKQVGKNIRWRAFAPLTKHFQQKWELRQSRDRARTQHGRMRQTSGVIVQRQSVAELTSGWMRVNPSSEVLEEQPSQKRKGC